MSEKGLTMNILLFSDFHNSVDIEMLKDALSRTPFPDAVFTLGDISVEDLQAIKIITTPAPIYGIAGNHDTHSTLELADIPNIHGKVVEIGGLRFTGFDGSIRYKHGSYVMYSHKESLQIAKGLPKVDILLSHDKAFAGSKLAIFSHYTQNPHEGLAGITAYLKKTKPVCHIHGHIHENKRYSFKDIDTISVYQAAALSVTKDGVDEIQVLIK